MLNAFVGLLDRYFGNGGGGLTRAELEKLTERSRLSDYLPWVTYEPETMTYGNADNTTGFLWECLPLSFAGEKTVSTIEGLFRSGLPEGSILQFILYSDDYIEPIIEEYRSMKVRRDPIIEDTTKNFTGFLLHGARGLKAMVGIPARNFRLFVALKFPPDREKLKGFNVSEIYSTVQEILRGCMLNPRPVTPPMLLDWQRRFFNNAPSMNNAAYDENVPIRKQVILDAVVTESMSSMTIGKKIFRCTTPKLFPKEVDFFQTNGLFGGVWGVESDGDQIRTPFLYTLNVIFNSGDLRKAIHKKGNFVLVQGAAGSFVTTLARKKEEFLWATDEIEKGTPFVTIIPIMWVWGESDQQVVESITRVKMVWERAGYVMQEDKGILKALLLSSLPFGLINDGKNVESLERHFFAPPQSLAHLAPIQADYAGSGHPALIFLGRKGQLCSLDIFHPNATNHNCLVAASSGSGKSFFVNGLAYNYYANGARVRIIDIGGSYKKLANMFKGRFLDFHDGADICINPFGTIANIKDDLSVVAAIFLQMIFSVTDTPPVDQAETAMTLIKEAVTWAWNQKGKMAGVDEVHQYLGDYPDLCDGQTFKEGSQALDHTKKIAHELAFNLSEFTSQGRFGKWFNGESNFDISEDEFVVLELEKLRTMKELFKVVTLQILNAVTQDAYLTDRRQPRLIIFDEAYMFLGGDNRMLKEVIDHGYRRARKYLTSFTVITQSLMDLKQFGEVGDVIKTNSAFKFLLEAPNYGAIREEGIIEYDEFTMRLLKGVRSNKPFYSEVFIDSPFGIGVGRLLVDPYSYYVYTSSAKEIAEIESLVREGGLSYDKAIRKMVETHRSHML